MVDYIGTFIGAFFGTTAFMISIALFIITILGWWKLFEKAGIDVWKCLIPLYNMYCLYEISFGRGKGWLFILTLIPCVNFVMMIIQPIKLSQSFGKGGGYAVGLIFLPTIFYLLLGFGSARYIGPQQGI